MAQQSYDSAELREELDERGTKPVIPSRVTNDNFNYPGKFLSNLITRTFPAGYSIRPKLDEMRLAGFRNRQA
jgi:hypothetical protein